MKEKILLLRSQGLTYNQIVDILGCSKGTVSYHCGKGQKEKSRNNQRKRRREETLIKKIENFKTKTKLIEQKEPTSSNSKRTYNHINKFQRSYPEDEMRLAWNRDDFTVRYGSTTSCYLTGDPIDLSNSGSYQFDHRVPRSKGGDNSLDNLGICTPSANRAKHSMSEKEFVQLCIKVVTHHGYSVEKQI